MINAHQYIPLDYRITYQLGNTYLKIINYVENKDYIYAQAQNAYSKTLELYPNLVGAHLKLGVVLAHINKQDNAIEHWLKCIELGKEELQCYYNLYIIFKEKGDFKKSQEYYQKYADLVA